MSALTVSDDGQFSVLFKQILARFIRFDRSLIDSRMATSDLTNLPGIGPATADKLTEAGFDSYLKSARYDSSCIATCEI